jgi:hypothetical protein
MGVEPFAVVADVDEDALAVVAAAGEEQAAFVVDGGDAVDAVASGAPAIDDFAAVDVNDGDVRVGGVGVGAAFVVDGQPFGSAGTVTNPTERKVGASPVVSSKISMPPSSGSVTQTSSVPAT